MAKTTSPSPATLKKLNGTRVTSGTPKKGTLNRKHIVDGDITEGEVTTNWMLHATKGWRSRRVHGAAE